MVLHGNQSRARCSHLTECWLLYFIPSLYIIAYSSFLNLEPLWPNAGPDPGFSVGGGAWTHLGGGGFGFQRGHFSVKMYVKMKELGPVGGGVHQHAPPRSAYGQMVTASAS